jgi:23S rRNA pseudouridine1911/1915/1917 synthase
LENTDPKEQNENSELYEHYRFIADKKQSLLRIDKFLFHKIENVSRTKIQAAADAGCILVNERPVKSNYKIKPSDIIAVLLPHPPHEFEIVPEDIPINILYEDNDLVVVNKPAGMVVHPAHGNYSGTLVNALSYHFSDITLFNRGESRPGLVHRIDKNTSGLLVIAKNEFAMSHLAKQFYERKTQRLYTAIVWGSFDEKDGTIEGNISRDPKDRLRMHVTENEEEGKSAVTHYRVLEQFGYISVVECKLETGRTHQIRVHMQHIGHPLFNDDKYGGNRILKGTTFTKYRQFVDNCFKLLPRQALHARTLGFKHPRSKEDMYFESDIPDDMKQVIEKWRRYVLGRDEPE